MTLPLGQLTLRERSAPPSLVEPGAESKGFRHGLCEKPLTVRAWRLTTSVTGTLQWHATATRGRSCEASWRRYRSVYSSTIVTEVIATGESGMSRLLRGALTILSTTSMPLVTWPKIV